MSALVHKMAFNPREIGVKFVSSRELMMRKDMKIK